MSVYVDDMQAQFGRMKMCHMIADSSLELNAMAVAIGVAPKWIQRAQTAYEHFDIALSKRAQAIAQGAIAISQRELAQKCRDRT